MSENLKRISLDITGAEVVNNCMPCEASPVSEEEMEFITKFRNLSDNIKQQVISVLNSSQVFRKRDSCLSGFTYKIKSFNASSEKTSTLYITINHIEEDGKYFPFEIFIHTKDTSISQWTSALSVAITTIFRMSKNDPQRFDLLNFIEKNLQKIKADAGYFDKDSKKFMKSQVDHIGEIIKVNFNQLKAMEEKQLTISKPVEHLYTTSTGMMCPQCKTSSLIKEGGCERCTNCDYLGSCG